MLLKRLVITLLFAPLIASQAGMRPTRSQTAGLTTRVQATARPTTEQKLSLLDEIIREAASLRLGENRALVQALAAELLWTYDERRARSLFDEAATNLAQMAAAHARDEAERESVRRAYGEVRMEVLQAAARRDPRLARALTRATGGPEPGSEVGPGVEMSIAMRMAADDPEQAAGLAAETLRQGVSGELPELISRLQSSDQRAAAVLASAVTTKLRSSSLSASADAVQVALDLLRMGSESATARVPLLDQQSLRALAEELAAESAKSPDDAGLLVALEPLLPVLDRYAPARAARVRGRLARLNAAAGGEGDSEADDEAGGAARRGVTPAAAAKEEGESEARKAPSNPATPEGRVESLIESAKAEAAKNDKRRAFELLEEAHGLVGGRAGNLSQLCKQLQVAAAFAPLDPARSFGIAGAAAEHVNELANAAAVLDGFVTGADISRDGELVLTAVSGYLSAFPGEGAEGFAMLARTEFDGLVRVTDGLQRVELRLMARLLVLQSVTARR